MDDRKSKGTDQSLRRRVTKVLADLINQRHWAKQAADRAGDDRNGQDRIWWTARADGLHFAVTNLAGALNEREKEAKR